MKTFTTLTDKLTAAFCSRGPLQFIGRWWWKRRLSTVHSALPMESYVRRQA